MTSEDKSLFDNGFVNKKLTFKPLEYLLKKNDIFKVFWGNDIGHYGKLLPLLKKKWKEDCLIITLDDDTVYNLKLIKNMVEDYKKNKCVICYRGFTPDITNIEEMTYLKRKVPAIPKYIYMINLLSDKVISRNYDLILTIDSPDFNYPLSRKIRKKGYKKNIFHVVAPTVWAWRKNRAKKFAEIYNHIFTLFSFENIYFEKYKLKSTCIGHPIYYIKKNSKKFKKNYIAFLPGSDDLNESSNLSDIKRRKSSFCLERPSTISLSELFEGFTHITGIY